MEQIRTHTRRDSPLNGTDREGGREGGRDGGTEGKFLKIIVCTNGTERNGIKWIEMEQNGTDQNTHMERFTVGLGRAYNLRARVGLRLKTSGSGFFGLYIKKIRASSGLHKKNSGFK